MPNNEFLYDAFNRYFERGIAAKEAGDIDTAKSQLILAAETLKKLAEESTGELKRSRQERVLKILDTVENLNNKKSNSGNIATRTKNSDSGNFNKDLGDNKSGDSFKKEDSETDWVAAVIPDMNFSKVAGLEKVKSAAKDMIIDPFIYPDLYKKHNLKSGGGIMMFGLPGTGKTTIAKAIAGEVNGKFFNVKCSDIFSKWVGEAERNVKNLFATARAQERSVIFFDDCDSIGGGRNNEADVTGKKVLTELLVQIDGVDSDNSNLLLLAATNAPWNMDGALTRTGRFEHFLEIPLPDEHGREFLIKRELKSNEVDKDIDIAEMVFRTDGYSGADIIGVCNYAKRMSLARDKEARNKGETENSIITQNDISVALDSVRSSIKKIDREKLEAYKKDNGII